MGVRGLRDYAGVNYKVTLTEAQARQHRSAFFRTYPGLATWHRQVGAELDRKKRVDTRTFTGRRQAGVTAYTVALNTPVQGTGADGLKLALARLFEHRAEVPEAGLIACVHDEVVMECPVALADQTTAWLKHHMIGAMQEVIGEAVAVEVETTVGRDWAGTPLEAPEEEASRCK
jgi:DNA polymerase I